MTENLFDVIARMGGTVRWDDGGGVEAVLLDTRGFDLGIGAWRRSVCLARWSDFVRWAKMNIPGKWYVGIPVEHAHETWVILDPGAHWNALLRRRQLSPAPPEGWMTVIDGVDFAEVRPLAEPAAESLDPMFAPGQVGTLLLTTWRSLDFDPARVRGICRASGMSEERAAEIAEVYTMVVTP